jgi:hypothetical protein
MKFKLFRFLSALALLCFLTSQIKAQSNPYFIPTVFQKSPNSTASAKYGDYPVNLYSGLPDISIPLYTVEAGGLKVPIVLSYHASGLKVNELASYVGAGWSLNASGEITRQVVGTPDEGPGGYFGGLVNIAALSPDHSDADATYLWATVTGNAHDNRPDIFSYNIPGHNGKFFFDGTASFTPRFIPFAPLQVNYKIVGTGVDTLHFTMLDEHGTTFIIGNNYRENTTTAYLNGTHTQAITSWKLERMISQNRRDTINFSYVSQNMAPPDQVGQVETVEDEQTIVGGTGCVTSYINTLNPVISPSNTSVGYNEEDINQILFKNGKVTFTDSLNRSDITTGKMLNNIKVYTYNYGLKRYEIQKTIVFYQSNFNLVGGTGISRLRLDSIQILDKAGSVMQHYRFVYNNQPVPAYTSYSKDFWGYYNGKMDGVTGSALTLIPQTTIDYYSPNASSPNSPITIGASSPNTRDPDSTKMQAGVLKAIYYPTGGHTTFAYQTNRYVDGSGVTHLTGGLRIDTITSFDNINSTPIVKTYQYNKTYPTFMTSGFSGLLNFGFFMHGLQARFFNGNPGPCAYKRVRTYYSESSLNLTGTEGNPVAYTNVTEYIGTPGNNVGKSVYTFRYHADAWDGSASSTQVPVTLDYAFDRGQMLSKTDYRLNSDGSYQPVKKVTNSYTAYAETSYPDVGMVVGQLRQTDGENIALPSQSNEGDSDGVGTYPYVGYSIVSDDNYLTGSTTQTYDTSDTTKYTLSSTGYGYGNINYQQIATIAHTDSKGNTITSNEKYAFDYPQTGGTTGNSVLDSMISRHMYSEPIEQWNNIYYPSTSTTATTSGQLNIFKFGNITGTIVPSTISILNISTPLSGFTPSSVVSGAISANSNYTRMISFDQYDPKNNIVQYTPRNSAPVSILWDYLYELPIAKAANAIISTTNMQIAYTSFEADGKGSWSFSGTPVKDVTAPTGVMVYPLSAGSVTTTVLDNTRSYVVSYWSNNGAATLLYGSTYYTGTPLRSYNGWTYYEHQLPSASSGALITISGTTSIDELRLYPADAQMTTYTYDPSGLRAIADTKGQVSYFEYDPFQRLKNIKDWNGNIVKNYGYHNYDMTVGNDAMGPTTFTRDNCPSGTSPQSTTYSVPASKYLSSTKASANAEAQYDLNSNGQALADNPAICGCPITTFNFTLTNSSGYTGWTAVFTIGGTPTTYNFPTSGSTTVPIPVGTYTTVYVGPIGSATHTFTLGSRTPITGAHSATFNSVVIATSGSTDTSLTVQ